MPRVYGYRCSAAAECSNKGCFHRKEHIPGYTGTVNGKYRSCASRPGICSKTKLMKQCNRMTANDFKEEKELVHGIV